MQALGGQRDHPAVERHPSRYLATLGAPLERLEDAATTELEALLVDLEPQDHPGGVSLAFLPSGAMA